MPEALGRFFTLADTAEVLSITTRQVQQLIAAGELPAIKVGSQWRVERSVLEGYIAAMYEETRRTALWNQADFGDLAEFRTRER